MWKIVITRRGNYYRDYISPSGSPNGSNFSVLLDGFGLDQFRKIHLENSFYWLIEFLREPNEKLWELYAFVHGLIKTDYNRFGTQEGLRAWLEAGKRHFSEEIYDLVNDTEVPCLYGLFEPDEAGDEAPLSLYVKVNQSAVRPGNVEGMRVACILNDQTENRDKEEFESIWNGYLRLYNLFQFIPHSYFVTQIGLSQNAYENLYLGREVHPEMPEEKTKDVAWAEAIELTDASLHDLLGRLMKDEWPAPEVGYEFIDKKGEIIATAELAWPELRIAFLHEGEMDFLKTIEQMGWTGLPLADVLAAPDLYASMNKP